jgi:hypothetical protein
MDILRQNVCITIELGTGQTKVNIEYLDTLVKPDIVHADRIEGILPSVRSGLLDPYSTYYHDENVIELREKLMKLKLVTKSMKGRFASRDMYYKIIPLADIHLKEFIMMLVIPITAGEPWEVT